MRVPLVAANWKMHGSRSFVERYFPVLQGAIEGIEVEVAVFPPLVYLQSAVEQASDSGKVGIAIGGQNLSHQAEGAFTGEVSAAMLTDTGCRMALVGHSERRSLFSESNEMVASKFMAAVENGLMPVLCVGETLEQREQGQTLEVVTKQLQSVIDVAGEGKVTSAVIAYEPVWAIGTGKTATPEQAQEVHHAIREFLGAGGEQTRILYGGSVKAANAQALFSQADIDGGLVGGASLDAEEFSVICKKAQNS